MVAEALGCAAVGIWTYLLFGRGGFWRLRVEDPVASKNTAASVAVVIPARDEADVIGLAVRSLKAQQYSGRIDVFVVDDASSDGTAEAARGVTVLSAGALPAGWTGKLWALSRGVERASASNPDWILLTDADIVHAPGNIASLVARAQAGGLDLASIMVRLRCSTLAERALIPAFLFFFLKLYPPRWIADSRSRTAGAAGGCILIRPSMLERIGGIASIRGELIDDCALARKVKAAGGRIWMGVSLDSVSLRGYAGFGEMGRMIARTAFTQLRYSWLLVLGAVAGMLATYVAGPALLIWGPSVWARGLGAAAWALMIAAYWPSLRFYGMTAVWALVWALMLPAVAVFYTAATLYSGWAHWRGRGGGWKGRYFTGK